MTAAPVDLDGLVYGMPDPEYRAVPRISQSGLKTILDCPARYVWETENRVEKKAFDFGHIVHAELLGTGLGVHVVDAPDWKTKAAREAGDEARLAGLVPLLAHEYERVKTAVAAVRAHPLAGPMLAHDGDSEVAMFWTDKRTGIECKALADRVTVTADGTHWLPDVKTTGRSARPAAFARDAATFGYHVQDAFYQDGYFACTGVQPRFLDIVVETTAPHLVSVVELDEDAVNIGRDRYSEALDIYQRCVESGVWHGYTETFAETISLPRWATY